MALLFSRYLNRHYKPRRRYRWIRFGYVSLLVLFCSLSVGRSHSLTISSHISASHISASSVALASDIRTAGIRTADIRTAEAQSLVEAGVARYEANDFFGAIELWQALLESSGPSLSKTDRSTVLENLARVHQRIGHTVEAANYWEQAIQQTASLEDLRQLGRLRTEQAQLFSQTGQQLRAIALLCGTASATTLTTCTEESAVALATSTGDRLGRAAALGSLGEVLRRQRNYSQAQTVVAMSLAEAQATGSTSYQISALGSLGTLHLNQASAKRRRARSLGEMGEGLITADLKAQADGHAAESRRYFEQSLAIAQQAADKLGALRSQLSLISLYRQTGADARAQAAQENALRLLQQLPNDASKVEATIALAHLIQFEAASGDLELGRAFSAQCFEGAAKEQTQALLVAAAEQAKALSNERAASFAVGSLGHWYECQEDYPRALQLTQQAQWLADQQRQAQDSLYLWQWQTGRLYLAQNKLAKALQSYHQAVLSLDSIRNDLLASNQDLQFDFRETVEPVYRQAIALQLETPETIASTAPVAIAAQGARIQEAIATLDSLKLAELQNYFGSDCEIVPFANTSERLTGTASTAATVTSIVLGERTAIVLSLPNQKRWISWIPVDAATLRETVNEFRQELERFYDLSFDTALAEQLYGWIIRPFEAQLVAEGIDTLVFVSDGILRSIPMAALHDGKQFLAQTYATATVPALSLVVHSNLTPNSASALVMGLTKSATVDGQPFSALPFVNQEVLDIHNEIPNSQILLNEAFTSQRLSEELSDRNYSVLHIATHAQFGANPEDAFLITGRGEKLTFGEMDRLIRSSTANQNKPIELLALTACETAIGDDRAALGVGGVAVRAGAKSAIASLWSISDENTAKLAAKFYQGLVDKNQTKAKALQQAQISLIEENQHPAFWSPLIVVGNWT